MKAEIPSKMYCPKCGTESSPSHHFCANCGAPLEALSAFQSLFRAAELDRTGFMKAVLVVVFCCLVSFLGWIPLGLPSSFFVKVVPPGSCGGLTTKTAPMYFCSAKVAFLTQLGPIVIMALLFLARGYVARGVRWLVEKVPLEARFLAAPVVATVFFTLVWTASNADTAFQSGLLPQIVFPSVIGLFTYLASRYGPSLQRLRVAASFLQRRDKLPRWLRIAIAALIPLIVSLSITFQDRVTAEAQKAQAVVLVGLCTGYWLLVPTEATKAEASLSQGHD